MEYLYVYVYDFIYGRPEGEVAKPGALDLTINSPY